MNTRNISGILLFCKDKVYQLGNPKCEQQQFVVMWLAHVHLYPQMLKKTVLGFGRYFSLCGLLRFVNYNTEVFLCE